MRFLVVLLAVGALGSASSAAADETQLKSATDVMKQCVSTALPREKARKQPNAKRLPSVCQSEYLYSRSCPKEPGTTQSCSSQKT